MQFHLVSSYSSFSSPTAFSLYIPVSSPTLSMYFIFIFNLRFFIIIIYLLCTLFKKKARYRLLRRRLLRPQLQRLPQPNQQQQAQAEQA